MALKLQCQVVAVQSRELTLKLGRASEAKRDHRLLLMPSKLELIESHLVAAGIPNWVNT